MGAQEWLIIAVVVLVLFGGSQLPKLARSLGEAQKEFKKGVTDASKNDKTTVTAPRAISRPRPSSPSSPTQRSAAPGTGDS